MKPLPLSVALRRAGNAGVEATVVVRVVPVSRSVCVSLATTDADPTVALVGEGGEQWLGRGTPSGPERRDYKARILCHEDRFALRLRRDGTEREVAILPAAFALLREHGWSEDDTRSAEAVVDEELLDEAVVRLLSQDHHHGEAR